MALTRRQELAYEDTCNIWKPNALTYVGSEPQEPTYTQQTNPEPYGEDASDVFRCLLCQSTNVSAPKVIGRFGQDNIFTLDVIRFDAAVDIDDNYVLKLTTPGAYQNTFWMVMGDAQIRISRARRQANFKGFYLKALPSPPEGVS